MQSNLFFIRVCRFLVFVSFILQIDICASVLVYTLFTVLVLASHPNENRAGPEQRLRVRTSGSKYPNTYTRKVMPNKTQLPDFYKAANWPRGRVGRGTMRI